MRHSNAMSPKPRWDKTSQWVIGAFVGRSIPSQPKAWGIIALLVGLIGISDYFAGIEISLSIFYLIPISMATGWLGASAGVSVAVGCTVVRTTGDLLIQHPHILPWRIWWNVSAAFAIFLFVVWLVHSLITLHHQLEGKIEKRTSELMESMADRDRLQQELLEVGDRERSAVGRELHDELGQHLVATAMAAQVLARRVDPKSASDATAIVRWIEEAIAKSRRLARGLLLSSIAPERFAQELDELAAASSHGTVQCRLLHQGGAVQAGPTDCAQLFRIAQEAVTNALRHAQAKTVNITLATDDHALCLIVEDDGCGVPASTSQQGTGMGLRIMEHRAKFIGASFSVLSMPGEGTKIICRLPRHRPIAA